MSERWLPVPDSSIFEVSDAGSVRRWAITNKWWCMILRVPEPVNPSIIGGYKKVFLRENGEGTRFSVHRLVLSAFQPVEGMESLAVRHLDGNPMNNSLSNLAWGTWQDNADDRARHGTTSRGESHTAKLTEGQVREMLALRGKISGRQIARMYGVGHSAVQAILAGRAWKHVHQEVN